MKNYLIMLEQIKRDEGFSSTPYRCPADKWTIGYGSTYLWHTRRFTPVFPHTLPINRYQAEMHLVLGVNKAIKGAGEFVTNFDDLTPIRQCVLTMMAYQLGNSGLKKFKKTKRFIEAGNWKAAAVEMLDSKWARQTYKRAERTADIFYRNKWQ